MFSGFDSRLSFLEKQFVQFEKIVSDLQEKNLSLEKENKELKTGISFLEKQFEKNVSDLQEKNLSLEREKVLEDMIKLRSDCESYSNHLVQRFAQEIKTENSQRHGNVLIGLFRPFHYYVELPFFVNKHISYTNFLQKIRQITPQSREGFTIYIDSLSEFSNINKIDLADFPSRKVCFENSLTGFRCDTNLKGDWQLMSFDTKQLLHSNFSKHGITLLFHGVIIEM
jgi:exonuclease VII small subunit